MSEKNSYSENNYKTFGAYVSIIGTFLAAFSLYVNISINCKCCSSIILLTGAMYLIMLLLSVLSIVMGYERRRDHIVSSFAEEGSPYVIICGNGKDKKWFEYLPNLYMVFLCFFVICIILFSVYNCLYYKPSMCFSIITCITELVVIISIYHIFWREYKKRCKVVLDKSLEGR